VSRKKQPPISDNPEENDNPVLSGLMQGLQSVFDKIHKDNSQRDHSQEKIIEEFSERLNHAFDQVHTEAKEREQLLSDKLKAIETEQRYRIQRIKIFSVPGTLIALVAMGYLFYVVNVMERSMTSMSTDMHDMRGYIANISGDTRNMSQGVLNMNVEMVAMNGNMSQIDNHMVDMNDNIGQISTHVEGMNGSMSNLNRSVGVMTHDVGNMSHTISPLMSGFRTIMPF